jgi:hypothetical protein
MCVLPSGLSRLRMKPQKCQSASKFDPRSAPGGGVLTSISSARNAERKMVSHGLWDYCNMRGFFSLSHDAALFCNLMPHCNDSVGENY